MSEQIEGRNPVLEALRAGHELVKIFIQKGDSGGPLQDIQAQAAKKHIPVQVVEVQALNRMAATRNHQGVIAIAAAWEYASLESILARAAERNEPPFLLLLDGVEDPQNLGSIIRTADAAGIHGVIIPERRAAGLTTAVDRASAGALEYVPVARVTNLTKTMEELKKQGIWFYGAEADAPVPLEKADLKGPLGLVLGSEGSGISRLVAEHCDQLVRLPMYGKINSLNVSVAAGIFMYEARRRRAIDN
jgi:23S rRNA (guanosine2251-2'-O)-methyltransferase